MDFSWLIWWFALVGFMVHFFAFLVVLGFIDRLFDAMKQRKTKFTGLSCNSAILRKTSCVIFDVLFVLTLVLFAILSPIIVVLVALLTKSLYITAYRFGRAFCETEIRKRKSEESRKNF